ncbi:MAG: VOC family protein [Pyrinomonadaceae bacterium]
MQEQSELRFSGLVDHIAVPCEDLQDGVREYERIGFKLETLYDDWAMLRDPRGFGLALLPPGSKHPPHLGLRVETRDELEEFARREKRPVKEHRDRTASFYTKGVAGQIVEVIYYPPDYKI